MSCPLNEHETSTSSPAVWLQRVRARWHRHARANGRWGCCSSCWDGLQLWPAGGLPLWNGVSSGVIKSFIISCDLRMCKLSNRSQSHWRIYGTHVLAFWPFDDSNKSSAQNLHMILLASGCSGMIASLQAFCLMTPSTLFDDQCASQFLLQPASIFSMSLWPS